MMACRIETFQTDTVCSHHRYEILENINGEIKLAGAPYNGLVLEDGSSTVPLIPVDSAGQLVNWATSVGRRVSIKKLLAVSESFQDLSTDSLTEVRNYMVKWADVKVVGQSASACNNPVTVEVTEAEEILTSDRTCHIVVHHVSIPFHVKEDALSFCLVLISYTKKNCLEEKLWLVLQGPQVAWREFLVPNREYQLHFPPGVDKFYFDKSQKPLDSVMERNIREIRVIFHHKIHFARRGNLRGSTVPPGSRLFLCDNSNFSEYIYRFTSDILWFKNWFSVGEADHATTPLVTFYGKVTSVKYLKEDVYKSCYLCMQKKPKEPEVAVPRSSVAHPWADPFKSTLSLGKNKLIELPNITTGHNSRMNTGVPGKLVCVIDVEDLWTGETRCVYTKHSYVDSCQQMARLAPGVIVCLPHLHRRCSAAGRYYYISTMMTSCRVLSYEDRATFRSDGWGVYGLRELREAQAKTWGVLEPFQVDRVGIRPKCDFCRGLFSDGRCVRHCRGPGTFTVSPYAIAWIDVTHDDGSMTKEKLLIRGDYVRRMLQVPEEDWRMLKQAAIREEIFVSKNMRLDEANLSPMSRYLQTYFSVKPRRKFYICVKRLPSKGDKEIYFCVDLAPVSDERLNTVAGKVN